MSNNKIQSINPTTEEVIKEFDLLTDDQLKSKLKLAEETFKSWKNSSFELRAQCMNRVAELLDQKSEKYGYTITEETGKTLSQGISEPKKCAKWCRWYAENAKRILSDKVIKSESGKKTMIVHQPMGILLQIAPFNYPFLQCLRFLTACLMAGNVALIRHSHSVTLSALLIEQLFLEAGFPHGCVQVLLVTKDQVSHLIADPRIRGVTITGSTEAGKAIARQAGENVKKNVMELGGSDAYIICEDADLDKTIDECVKGRIVNNGQSCTSAKRFIVNEAIYNEFCEKFSAKMKSLKMGDPMKEDTDVGPMSRKDLRDNTHEYVLKSIADGAKLLCGGEIVQGMKGFFYPPTALCDVTTDNFAFKNEIFGPVAAIIKSKNDYHAIELCNASRYGLGGGVFTNDENRGERIAREMEVGLAFVNRIVTSMPNYPFGGVKDSGYGKECGEEGILEWCNTKSLIVK